MRQLIRSALFVPAIKPRAVEKAAHLGADMLVLDLEDSVGPDEKSDARAHIAPSLKAWEASGAIRCVRVNGLETEWGPADMRLAADADAVLLPKVSSVGDLHDARAALNAHGRSTPIWAMIETPLGVVNVNSIAGSTGTGLAGLMAGTNDLAKELRCASDMERVALVPHLASMVAAARAHGLYVLDGVFNQFRDEAGLREEARQGRALGFDGKSLIHPSQIESTHQIFGPSPEDLEKAARIVAAFADPENAGKGVIALDGDMVERLHLEAARQLLSTAGHNDA